MSNESEVLGLASIGAISPGGKADLSGQPCRNCGELVDQRHCPRCGQLAASYHRPFYALITESISDSFALDGRLARTMPLLFFRPGVLTRRYTEGKRARYVPPFRLFLLSSLIFYFVVFAFLGQVNWLDFANANVDGQELTDEQMEDLRDAFIGNDGTFDEARFRDFIEGLEDGSTEQAVDDIVNDAGDTPASDEDGSEGADTPAEPAEPAEPAAETGETTEEAGSDRPSSGVVVDDDMFAERIERISQNPRVMVQAVETWLPRFSLLLVPFTMLAMSLMYFWRRKVFVYDHAIHALNLHSWIFLAATLAMLIGLFAGAGWASAIFFIALPIYVTFSLRGAYRSGFITSFLRMMVLAIFWTIALSILSVGVVIASVMSV